MRILQPIISKFQQLRAWRAAAVVRKRHWRAKRYTIALTSRVTCTVIVRRFQTNPAKRSKKYTPRVFTVPFGAVKEISVHTKVYARRRPRSRGTTPLFHYSNMLILLGVCGVTYFGVQFSNVYAAPIPPAVEKKTTLQVETTPAPHALSAAEPQRLTIPSIGVDTSINSVGQETNGELETPALFSHTVGWYRHSPTPGEIGPSVLVGHVDTYKGPSVFWNLATITPGSEIVVQRKDNSTARFRVTTVEQYEQHDFPTEQVYGNTDDAQLRLITCGGSYNYLQDRYSANTVVYATLLPDL